MKSSPIDSGENSGDEERDAILSLSWVFRKVLVERIPFGRAE